MKTKPRPFGRGGSGLRICDDEWLPPPTASRGCPQRGADASDDAGPSERGTGSKGTPLGASRASDRRHVADPAAVKCGHRPLRLRCSRWESSRRIFPRLGKPSENDGGTAATCQPEEGKAPQKCTKNPAPTSPSTTRYRLRRARYSRSSLPSFSIDVRADHSVQDCIV